MSINEIIATNSMHAYEVGVTEGRKQVKEELEALLAVEVKELEQHGPTGLYSIHKVLHFLRKEAK
jgi:hypothetical protein